MTDYGHEPVLLNETLEALNVRAEGIYIDCTVGRCGHTAAILERLGAAGRLLALDRDPQAISAVTQRFGGDQRVAAVHASYASLLQVCRQRGWIGNVDGVLFDLGVSSPQLDDPHRGFSFMRDGELDMRFDQTSGRSAADWLNTANAAEIANVLYRNADEKFSRRIAAAIIREREQQPIRTTRQLANIVAAVIPGRERDKHPATRTFQAIRMHVNAETEELETALPMAVEVLRPGGRLAVISFHSIEDRLVKRFMRKECRGDRFPEDLPVTADVLRPRLRTVVSRVRPTVDESERNPRSRSATLRVAEKLPS